MIGYYVMTSPSQNLSNTQTDNVMDLADLRSRAECVVAKQNAIIDGKDYDDECVNLYNVTGYSFCVNTSNTVTETCDENDNIYVVTKSCAIDGDKYGNMLKVLELFYQESGLIGIYQDSMLLTVNSSGPQAVNDVIINPSELQKDGDGCLVYIMNNKIPSGYQQPTPTNDPDNCPSMTKPIRRYGRWWCVPQSVQTACGGGEIWVPSLAACVSEQPIENEVECTEIEVTTTEKVLQCCSTNTNTGEEECVVTPLENVVCAPCPNDVDSVLNPNFVSKTFDCICPESEEDLNNCEDVRFITRNNSNIVGRTATVKIAPCNICERPIFKDCELKCIPDTTKLDSRSCYNGDPNQCKESAQCGIYFGFPTGYTFGGIKDDAENAISDAIFEKFMEFLPLEKRDRKFHSLDCRDYGGLNTDWTVRPYTAVCKNSTPVEIPVECPTGSYGTYPNCNCNDGNKYFDVDENQCIKRESSDDTGSNGNKVDDDDDGNTGSTNTTNQTLNETGNNNNNNNNSNNSSDSTNNEQSNTNTNNNTNNNTNANHQQTNTETNNSDNNELDASNSNTQNGSEIDKTDTGGEQSNIKDEQNNSGSTEQTQQYVLGGGETTQQNTESQSSNTDKEGYETESESSDTSGDAVVSVLLPDNYGEQTGTGDSNEATNEPDKTETGGTTTEPDKTETSEPDKTSESDKTETSEPDKTEIGGTTTEPDKTETSEPDKTGESDKTETSEPDKTETGDASDADAGASLGGTSGTGTSSGGPGGRH